MSGLDKKKKKKIRRSKKNNRSRNRKRALNMYEASRSGKKGREERKKNRRKIKGMRLRLMGIVHENEVERIRIRIPSHLCSFRTFLSYHLSP